MGKVIIRNVVFISLVVAAGGAVGEDHPQWGQRNSRNMVSSEKGLPDRFDPKTGENVLWTAALGSECYATPVVAGGKVLIGTNNNEPRDPRHKGDRGVLFCLNEADGSFCWQLVVPKLEGDIFLDWPNAGMCSPPTVEGNRVYMVTNRAEIVCLDLQGMANGNDGPYKDEARHCSPGDQPPIEPGPTDADILWLTDLRTAAGVRPHDSSHGSILIDGPFLYVNTSNGLNSKHSGVEKPDAPSLVVLEKATGRLVAIDGQNIGPRIFHSTWSSPALGEVGGRREIVFCGGDGVVYAFDPLRPEDVQLGPPQPLRLLWKHDCDPKAPKTDVHRFIRNRKESPSNIKSTPVLVDGRVYVTGGGDIWWGKNESWLQCIRAGGSGEVTAAGPLWQQPLGRHCVSTPSVSNGLVYVADCDGKVYCFEAATGQPQWVHETGGEIWASTLVADGKVYIGNHRGDFLIFAEGKEKKLLSSVRLPDPVQGTPVAANGTLYVSTMRQLYAVKRK